MPAVVERGGLSPGVLHEPRVALARGCPYSTRDTDPHGVSHVSLSGSRPSRSKGGTWGDNRTRPSLNRITSKRGLSVKDLAGSRQRGVQIDLEGLGARRKQLLDESPGSSKLIHGV